MTPLLEGPNGGSTIKEPSDGAAPRLPVKVEGIPITDVITVAGAEVHVEVEDSSEVPILEAAFRVDGGPLKPLAREGKRLRGSFDAHDLDRGEHHIEVTAVSRDCAEKSASATFRVRRSSP